jgi:transposase-like protein
VSPEDKALEAARAYAEHGSAPAVARQLGMSTTEVYRLLDRAGVERPNFKNGRYAEGMVKLRGAQAAAAAADYAAGRPMAELTRKYQVGVYAIRTAAKAAGCPERQRGQQPRIFSADERTRAVKMYASGLRQSMIAAELRADRNQVRRILMEEGVELRPRKSRSARS